MVNYVSKFILLLIYILTASCFNVCSQGSKNENFTVLKVDDFKKNVNGKNVSLCFLNNGKINMAITNYGARIVSLCVPDKNGDIADVVNGFKTIDDYLRATGLYHGAIIGRVAGRIKNGIFNLNDTSYTLQLNAGNNHLHGGSSGFHNQVWDIKSVNDTTLVLTYLSKDGEMGYPGNVATEVSYTLNRQNELVISYTASTDKSTPLNFTNHAFFNLAGERSGSINNHLLAINSDYVCSVNEEKMPTGKNYSVKDTPFDFRKMSSIGKALSSDTSNEQLRNAGGYDHHFVLKKNKYKEMTLAASVFEPKSRRKMQVFTTDPCIHFFSANFFKGNDTAKMGTPINYRGSFALETQNYPFSDDRNLFPSIIIKPDEKYESKTILRFSIDQHFPMPKE